MDAPRDASHRASVALLLAACGCFFITGAVALIYEICWIRKASLAFGSATWAVSAVLAIFFGGLALGSLIVGRYSPRAARPLRVFALLELGAGLTAILSPTLFALADQLYGSIYPFVIHSIPLLTLVRLAVVSLVILPATVLMGGSLPLFCQQFVRQEQRISRGVGLLYGLNTLGAAAGSALCGFWMIPNVGVNTSIYIAGGVNLVISLIAFWLASGPAVELGPSRADGTPAPSPPSATASRPPAPAIFGWLFFGVGFVALANEVLWTRYLALLMPNTVYTYTMTLTVVLLGIVIGSLLSALISDRLLWKAGLFGAAQVATGLAVMGVMQLRPAWWGAWLSPIAIEQQLGVILCVLLAPAVLSGMSFPLAVGLIVRDASQTGWDAGRMAAINMFGGIAGSLLVGFAALPWLGMQSTLYFTTGVSLLIGVAAWWILEQGPSKAVRASWIIVSALLWVAIPFAAQTRLPQDFLASEGTLVDYREGISDNVALLRSGDVLRLEINRMWQGQNRKNHQIMAAHVPAMLHRDPKSVLVIGLGTGQTASSFLLHDIDRLDCLEIEDGLVELVAQHFDAQWMQDPRFHLLVEDGRNYVTHTREQYDLISIEVGQIYRPGVASFYTADFYEQLRGRLRHDGIVCQFLPSEFFSPDEFRTLVATFLSVFPKSVLWYNTSELLLMGTQGEPIMFSPERLQARLAGNPRLQEEMNYAYWGGADYYLSRPEAFLAGFLCRSDQLQELGQGGDIYRDDRPYLEYISLLRRSAAGGIVPVLLRRLSPLTEAIASGSYDWLAASDRIRRMNLMEIAARPAFNRARTLEAEDRVQEAMLAYEEALVQMPDHPKANYRLGVLLQSQGRDQQAITLYRRALAVQPDDAPTLYHLAVALGAIGKYEEAEKQFRRALDVQADDAEANYGLAVLLQAKGALPEAVQGYERTLEADPNHLNAHLNLAGILAAQQRTEEAIAHYEKAVQLDPGRAETHVRLGGALAMIGRAEPAIRSFEEASRLQPNSAIAQLGRGNVLISIGRREQAAQAYLQAARLDPNLVQAQICVALVSQELGRLNQSLEHFQKAIRLAPDFPMALSGAAWILATHPDAKTRNPAKAVELAEKAWRISNQQDALSGDVLAAAYAADGQFEQAQQVAQQAIQLANSKQMSEFATQIQTRLELYQQQKPFVQ